MAIKKVQLSGRKRSQAQWSKDPNGKAQAQLGATDTWQVIFDGFVDRLAVFGASDGTNTLPGVGDIQAGLFCNRVNPIRSSESPFVWDVTVDWVNIQLPEANVWNVGFQRDSVGREETATKDRLGLPLVNTVGDLLPRLPNNTLYDEVVNITYSTKVLPPWANNLYEGYTNSDSVSFTICGFSRTYTRNQMKVNKLGVSTTKIITALTGGTPTYAFKYDITLQFQNRPTGWIWYAPNEGWNGWINNKKTLLRDKDRGGNMDTPLTDPTPLDVNGKPLTTGATIVRLPDDVYGVAIPHGSRVYTNPGAFELSQQTAFSGWFTGLNDDGS